MKSRIYWAKCKLGAWSMYLAATEAGLCYISTPDAPFTELEKWVGKHLKDAKLEENQAVLQPYVNELKSYLEGQCKAFTAKLDLYGTPFQQQVWHVLQEITYGETLSYTDVAERLQNPRAVRAVGGAIGANPVLFFIPCHRVITKDGKLGGFRAGLSMKEHLLTLEKSDA